MVDLITNHFVSPGNYPTQRFIKRFSSSLTIEDISNYLDKLRKEDLQPQLGSFTYTRTVDIEKKNDDNTPSSFFGLNQDYIDDYDPFGAKTDPETNRTVSLNITWCQSTSNSTRPVQIDVEQSTTSQTSVASTIEPLLTDDEFEKLVGNSPASNNGNLNHYFNTISWTDLKLPSPVQLNIDGPNPMTKSSDNPIQSKPFSADTEFDTSPLRSDVSLDNSPDENSSINSMGKESSSVNIENSQSQSKNLKRKRTVVRNQNNTKRRASNRNNKQYLPPEKMALIKVQRNNEDCLVGHYLSDYNPEDIPLISKFNPAKMLKFIRDINTTQEVEYLSDRQRKRQQIDVFDSKNASNGRKKFRKLVPIQGYKESDADHFEQILPVLEIPDDYMQLFNRDGQAFYCLAVVREYYVNDNKTEIGYHLVGNRRFLINANTENEEQVIHSIVKCMKECLRENQFELSAYMIQKPGELDKIVGPALFKIGKDAAKGVEINFKFGDGIGLYRLAIFFLKKTDTPGEYEPDFETLCLSNYLHQKKKQTTTATV